MLQKLPPERLTNFQAAVAGTPPAPTPTVTTFAGPIDSTDPTGPTGVSRIDGAYVGSKLMFLTGTNANQIVTVQGYTGLTGVFTVSPPLTSVPAAGDTFKFLDPMLLDGWRNPVIYVPTGGLITNLNVNGTMTQKIIAAIDRQGFWASAGQDGDFTQGDDNVYSTSVKASPYP